MSERTKSQLLAENERLRAEVERLDRIVNPPPPEPPEEPAPKPRLYVLALGELEKRIVPNAFQIPDAIKSIAPDAEWVPIYRLSDLPRGGHAVRVVDYVTAGFGRGAREIAGAAQPDLRARGPLAPDALEADELTTEARTRLISRGPVFRNDA